MQEIYIESLGKILQNKKKIEEELKVKIANKGKNIFIEGAPENEFIALEILKAMNLGFSPENALLLKDEEIMLQVLSIKELTRRKNLHEIKARIIGTHGKTIENIKKLSECEIALKNNEIGIIGNSEYIGEAIIALKSLIQGSKHGKVYARLEKEGKKRRHKSYGLIKNELKK